MNEQENTLLYGPVRAGLVRFALPVILSMLATQLYTVADTMVIGLRLDAAALAAVSNASTVLMIFLFVSGGMELGGGLLLAAKRPTATREELCADLQPAFDRRSDRSFDDGSGLRGDRAVFALDQHPRRDPA